MGDTWIEYYRDGLEREYRGTEYENEVIRRMPICEELEKKYIDKRMTFLEMNDKLYPMTVLYTDDIDYGNGATQGGTVVAVMPYQGDEEVQRLASRKYGRVCAWVTDLGR